MPHQSSYAVDQKGEYAYFLCVIDCCYLDATDVYAIRATSAR